MAGYAPLKITGMQTGLVQERENFLLPDDAYPVLQNAYVWRERILRKKGYQLLGRLQRFVDSSSTYGSHEITLDGSGNGNVLSSFLLETTATLVPGLTFVDTTSLTTYTDPAKDGVLSPSGTVNYQTGAVSIAASAGHNLVASFDYNPGLPVMGIRIRELQDSANDQTVFFDQKYAYTFNSGSNKFQEFIVGTTWNASNQPVSGTDFFWSTNYWQSDGINFTSSNTKLFWVTNNTGSQGNTEDPPRITDGTSWVSFNSGTWNRIDATTYLRNFLCMLPFRGRMVTFNTWEGPFAGASVNFYNRIRWSTIGNPFIPYAAGPPSVGSWRDDIRGQGGYLDIPTSEDIIAVGFVRDNLVIYCERSTWQLRYTGRSIAPFQIEKVNSELGTESTFAAVQFDTSLVGIGDKGIVECDSYKSERIDIKIPDFVYNFQSANNGVARVQGIRDFPNRLAYWTIPYASAYDPRLGGGIFPNQLLVYNYENTSWALFDDSLTALGNYQVQSSRTWLSTDIPWVECNFTWIDQATAFPSILGGTQQGFVEYLNQTTGGDVSLYISAITGMTTTATQITSPNHNLATGEVIGISGIPTGTPFATLNGGIFGIVVVDADNFLLYTYNSTTQEFSDPQLDDPATYIGRGLINIRDNFSIVSKKFNFLDEGQKIQLGYLDILMESTGENEEATASQGTPGNTDGSGNFLGTLSALFVLPSTAYIIPGTFQAVVGTQIYIETPEQNGFLLVNGDPAPPGTFINYTTTQLGLVTGLPSTPVMVSFNYYDNPPPVGEITLNIYLDYNDVEPSNTLPANTIDQDSTISQPDTFFNSKIPTYSSVLNGVGGTKFWQRVFCATRASFLTLEYTFSNAQLASGAQEIDVQIDAQILWIRKAGRIGQL